MIPGASSRRKADRDTAKLNACRLAYRARQKAKGLCVYCPQPAVAPHPTCFQHLMVGRDRAHAYFVANRDAFNAKRRAKHAAGLAS